MKSLSLNSSFYSIGKVILLVLSLFWLPQKLSAQNKVSIALFYAEKPKTCLLSVAKGEYLIKTGKSLLAKARKNDLITIETKSNNIEVKLNSRSVYKGQEINLLASLKSNRLIIKPVHPSLEARKYTGDFSFSCKTSYLLIVNTMPIAEYLAGTIETEGGGFAPYEYYKTQALLCRTYAAGHLSRHAGEGFNMCDGVHCQAFHGLSESNPEIQLAVKETHGEVIVDENHKLITAVFHSNCGGETVAPENVWSLPLPYLDPVIEDYCFGGNHAHWERSISKKDWIDYLKQKGVNGCDTLRDDKLQFDQRKRQLFYVLNGDSIPLKKIRADWNLKSTWFNIIPLESTLFIEGKGYGHGVGLCQEGAMEMAKRGYSYKEILRHYYKDIFIIDKSALAN